MKKAQEKKKAEEKTLKQRQDNYWKIINSGARVFKKYVPPTKKVEKKPKKVEKKPTKKIVKKKPVKK